MITISYFSYKGGAGRTSLLYNTLPFLAERLNATENEPIVVIDLDLDSKGFSYLVDKESDINAIQVLRGDSAIGYTTICGSISEHPLFSRLAPIGADVGLRPEQDRSILFISAHPKEGASVLTENCGNYDYVGSALKKLKKICQANKCKALIVDCPSGNQLMAENGLSASEKIVLTMRITKQFRKGTEEFLRKKATEFSGKEYIIVPNAVPSAENTIYSLPKTMSSIAHLVQGAAGDNNRTNISLIDNGNLGINEVQLFKFEENCLYKLAKERTLREDEGNAKRMYNLLAEELTKC